MLPAGPAFAATFNVGGPTELWQAWSAINSNGEADTLNITASFRVSIDLEFTDRDPNTLTINGNGHTLRLEANNEPFTVYPGRTLYLNNIIISGGDPATVANRGRRAAWVEGTLIADRLTVYWMPDGVITLSEGANLIVNNSLFRDNFPSVGATGGGGGVIRTQGGADIEIRNSRFINNTAEQASAMKAISSVGSNQQITTHANVTLYNNIFTGNTSIRTQQLCYNIVSECIPYTHTDFEFEQGALMVVGGFSAPNNDQNRFDVPGTFLDMRGNTITGNSHDCFVSDFVTITPQSYGANTIGPESNPTCLRLHRPPSEEDEEEDEEEDGDGYRPPPPSTCLTLSGIQVTGLSDSTQCQRVNAIHNGIQGSIDAVDVWGWVLPDTQVCFEASGGSFKFIDTAPMPRVVYDLPAFSNGGMVCATIDRAGILALLPGPPAPAREAQMAAPQIASRSLSDCMVRTQDMIRFRDAPGGALLQYTDPWGRQENGWLPATVTLTALERTPDWFKVDYYGTRGWVSARHVTPQGACG